MQKTTLVVSMHDKLLYVGKEDEKDFFEILKVQVKSIYETLNLNGY